MSVRIQITFSEEGYEDFLDLLYWISVSPLRQEMVNLAEEMLTYLEGDEN